MKKRTAFPNKNVVRCSSRKLVGSLRSWRAPKGLCTWAEARLPIVREGDSGESQRNVSSLRMYCEEYLFHEERKKTVINGFPQARVSSYIFPLKLMHFPYFILVPCIGGMIRSNETPARSSLPHHLLIRYLLPSCKELVRDSEEGCGGERERERERD